MQGGFISNDGVPLDEGNALTSEHLDIPNATQAAGTKKTAKKPAEMPQAPTDTDDDVIIDRDAVADPQCRHGVRQWPVTVSLPAFPHSTFSNYSGRSGCGFWHADGEWCVCRRCERSHDPKEMCAAFTHFSTMFGESVTLSPEQMTTVVWEDQIFPPKRGHFLAKLDHQDERGPTAQRYPAETEPNHPQQECGGRGFGGGRGYGRGFGGSRGFGGRGGSGRFQASNDERRFTAQQHHALDTEPQRRPLAQDDDHSDCDGSQCSGNVAARLAAVTTELRLTGRIHELEMESLRKDYALQLLANTQGQPAPKAQQQDVVQQPRVQQPQVQQPQIQRPRVQESVDTTSRQNRSTTPSGSSGSRAWNDTAARAPVQAPAQAPTQRATFPAKTEKQEKPTVQDDDEFEQPWQRKLRQAAQSGGAAPAFGPKKKLRTILVSRKLINMVCGGEIPERLPNMICRTCAHWHPFDTLHICDVCNLSHPRDRKCPTTVSDQFPQGEGGEFVDVRIV